MRLVYPFTAGETPELVQVGGKGLSLVFMTQHELPVPPGFVLTVAFFEPWLEAIKQTPQWAKVLDSSPQDLKQNCDAVKTLAIELELDDLRREVLAQALASLRTDDAASLFAVRSSSPEEDLEGLSFAGGYETTLGAAEEGLEDAVCRSFASCFDERVLVYKKEHALAVDRPRIAVIVQKQIAAETAGVAFSLNPINNCYDEAVINANFGLGESVVSGMVSPDSFTVDKVSRSVVERKTGSKETSVWLAAAGGTYKGPSPARSQLCLSDRHVHELTDLLVRVEDYYNRPVDIEWAFADGNLYLLQARPITAYVPLPEEMQTRPGEPRTLYIDLTMYKQGINEPLSVMGLEFWEMIQKAVAGTDALLGIKNGLIFNIGGRTYSNLSYGLKLQSKEKVAAATRIQDALSAEIIENLDDSYTAKNLPRSIKGALLEMALRRGAAVIPALRALFNPERHHAVFMKQTQRLVRDLGEIEASRLSPNALALRLAQCYGDYMANVSLPVTIAAEIARARIKKLFSRQAPEIRDRVLYLERALPNNTTVEMGLAMYHLACFQEVRACASAEEFAFRIAQRSFSPEFMSAWDRFMEKYGFRCPLELDVVTPRLYETPEAFYSQLRATAMNADSQDNPQAIYDRGVHDRQQAYEFLLGIARSRGKRQARRFRKYYDVLVTFGGYRETFKYYIVVIVDMLRKRALSEARSLVQAKRLDDPERVFELTTEDLDIGIADPSLDLRALAEENACFLRRIRHVRDFPLVIDSRGKILRPPKKEAKEGEVVGEPISAGMVRGKAKVLRRPDEKPVLPGEILVARATDPGWTPLFLNAGGIILEVGGILQHGALVAREYCKPCVAGIQNATLILRDGQMVELDGANGVVRLI